MSEHDGHNAPTYRIGAVSRLTGVPADTLRVWERRYGTVEPFRSDSGSRLYGPEDVGRLTLIKRLVDRGDAISSVANLSLHQLRERVTGADLPDAEELGLRPCRVACVGAALSQRLRRGAAELDGLELVGHYDRPQDLPASGPDSGLDLLLIDYPTVQPEQVSEIARLLNRSGAARAILLYRFATHHTLERLDARRILTKRGPVDLVELRRWCLALHSSQDQGRVGTGARAVIDISGPLPPRRYSDLQLAEIASASPTERCECPQHLADLITALAAFETYSDECELRHADDAALHAFLHAATAQARALIETALARVVAAEGIQLETRRDRSDSKPMAGEAPPQTNQP